MPDPLDDFIEFDLTMGADVVKCLHCGANVPCGLLIDDEVVCPECGKKYNVWRYS
jgi:DNA-directed RNA polymerase subunit RPC12/RpoP